MAQKSRPKLTDLVRAQPAPIVESSEPGPEVRTESKPRRGRRPSTDPRVSYTVGLRQSEVGELAEIAIKHHLAKNALGVFLLRYGMKLIREGKLKLPVRQKVVSEIEMP